LKPVHGALLNARKQSCYPSLIRFNVSIVFTSGKPIILTWVIVLLESQKTWLGYGIPILENVEITMA